MTEEIKEILDKLKDSTDNPINTEVDQFTEEAYDVPNYFVLDPTTNECKMLLDYITNLQQENERLKELVNPKTQIFIDTQDMEERYWEELYKEYLEKQLEDYKSRCEKAIEYIQARSFDEVSVGPYDDDFVCKENLLNILNGRSDE